MKRHAPLSAIVGIVVAWLVYGPTTNPTIIGPAAPIAAAAESQDSLIGDLDQSLLYHQRSDPNATYGGDAAARVKVSAGLRMFADAGLRLPPLRIYIHESLDGCGGAIGVFNIDGSAHRIDICGNIILHELAHAHEHHYIDDATRHAFMEHVDLDEWNHRDTQHQDRGIEHAANVIAWGVNAEPMAAGRVALYAEQLYRYELLTGDPSPRISHLAVD